MKKLTTLSAASLIKVQFFHSKDGGATEFYFGSLAAIYERFDASEIGCRLEALSCIGNRGETGKFAKENNKKQCGIVL